MRKLVGYTCAVITAAIIIAMSVTSWLTGETGRKVVTLIKIQTI